MITKNASLTIRRTLESYRSLLSFYYVLDTGSEDDTVSIILDTMRGEGEGGGKGEGKGGYTQGIVETETIAPWSFAVARNRAVERCIQYQRTHNIPVADYYIMPDDSYILHGDLGSILRQPLTANVIGIRIVGPDCEYYRKLIVRTTAGLRYEDDVHADIIHSCAPAVIDDPSIWIEDYFDPRTHSRSTERWHRDVDVILAQYGRNPSRNSFYLAMTYYALFQEGGFQNFDLLDLSLRYFKERLKYEDEAAEELFIAACNIALFMRNDRRKADTHRIEDILLYYHRAILYCPYRAGEAYYAMAQTCDHRCGKAPTPEKAKALRLMAYHYISAAVRYPKPPSVRLFLESGLYERRIPDMYIRYLRAFGDFDYEALRVKYRGNDYVLQRLERLRPSTPSGTISVLHSTDPDFLQKILHNIVERVVLYDDLTLLEITNHRPTAKEVLISLGTLPTTIEMEIDASNFRGFVLRDPTLRAPFLAAFPSVPPALVSDDTKGVSPSDDTKGPMAPTLEPSVA